MNLIPLTSYFFLPMFHYDLWYLVTRPKATAISWPWTGISRLKPKLNLFKKKKKECLHSEEQVTGPSTLEPSHDLSLDPKDQSHYHPFPAHSTPAVPPLSPQADIHCSVVSHASQKNRCRPHTPEKQIGKLRLRLPDGPETTLITRTTDR